MSNSYVIETPENIAFGYDVAGIGSRFLATLIDSLIQGTLYVIAIVAVSLADYLGYTHSIPRDLQPWLAAGLIAAIFFIQFGYFLLFEIVMHGQTPGKRLFNLQVVKENGYPLSVIDSILRNLVRIIDFFPVGYGVGLVAMFLNERARRLGDYAAGTIVVKLRDDVKLADLATVPVSTAPAVELPGLENLRPADIETVISYLRRRSEIRDATKLGGVIARAVRARMNAPQTEEYALNTSSDNFLLQVVSAYRRAHTKPG
ncbi:MAG: RDD family protein [Chloroflexi bacterium]|nr:RDD family protein [Chloroflexota bacterium]